MKKLKSSAREWIFENLLRLIFKFSESHKLVKFVKRPKDDNIYYDIQFKSEKVEESKIQLIEAFENYLTDLANKNSILDEKKSFRQKLKENLERSGWVIYEGREKIKEKESHLSDAEKYSNLLKWRNEGIVPDAVKDGSENLNPFIIRNGYQFIDNWIAKEIAEGSVDYMKVYKDHQIKVMKRAISENGYEIISEVKNGFIIARIGRHNENPAWNPDLVKNDMDASCIKPIQGDPSYYVHTLTGSLQVEAESIMTQLSTPDLSKQNFTKDPGVSESEMNEYLVKDMEKYESEKNLSEKISTNILRSQRMKKIPRVKIIDLKKIQSNELNEEILNRKRPESNLNDITKKSLINPKNHE